MEKWKQVIFVVELSQRAIAELGEPVFKGHDVRGRYLVEFLDGTRIYLSPTPLYIKIPLGSEEHEDIWVIGNDGTLTYEGTEEGYRVPPQWLLRAIEDGRNPLTGLNLLQPGPSLGSGPVGRVRVAIPLRG